jgi:hypothetical protein
MGSVLFWAPCIITRSTLVHENLTVAQLINKSSLFMKAARPLHCRVRKRPPLDPILSHINPILTLPSDFNINLLVTPIRPP